MKIKKSSSWWDHFLYLGIFLLALVFLYQLLKLWQQGTATLSNIGGTIAAAAGNTVAAVEAGLATLVTNPLALLSGLTGLIPDFLGLLTGFLGIFSLTGLLTGIASFIASLFGGITAEPISSGQGSSAPGATVPTTDNNALNPGGSFSATMQ